MDYYYHEFQKLQEEFEQVIHDYPLFSEMIDTIEEKNIKEINELLEKNDEYYLKKAIDELERLIEFIKNTSESIDKEYEKFNKLAKSWEKIEFINESQDYIDKLNNKINKANELINSHDLDDIKEANKIMENILKDIK